MTTLDWKNPGDILTRYPLIMERGPAILTIAIAILIAVKLADFTWRVFPGPKSQIPPAKVSQTTSKRPGVEVNQRRGSPQLVANLHLFGIVQKNAGPKEIPKELPETPLQLKLHGIVSTSIEGASLAVISDNTGRDDYYGVGDPLPQGNAILTEVHSDHIVLERNGRYETLRMPEHVDVGVQDASKESSGKEIKARGAGLRTPAYSTYDNAETRRLLKQYKTALSNNPQSLMSLVRARPVNENGKLKGYRIRPGRDPGLFGKFGLRPGDVVTGINGTQLNDPFKALEIVRDLKGATSLQVDIIRNGSPQSLNFNVDK